MQWRLLRQFPQCFGALHSEEDLTESQWLWIQCHYLLDDGVQLCPHCASLGVGVYCASCGTRVQPEPRLCDQCQTPGEGAYCRACGAVLRSQVEDAIDAGTFDWDAWAKSLTPFLGGLTPTEQRLLGMESLHGHAVAAEYPVHRGDRDPIGHPSGL